MIFKLVLAGLRHGKARFICAMAGVAAATGAYVFSSSLVATNAAQAPIMAQKACVPWNAWCVDGIELRMGRGAPPNPQSRRKPPSLPHTPPALSLKAVPLTVDYRPGGRVLQGPPMMAFLAEAPAENPYGSVKLTQGRWVKEGENEVVLVKGAMRRFGKDAPPLGSELKFVGRKCTMTAKIVGYMEGSKLPTQFPYVFANRSAFAALSAEKIGTVSFWKNPLPELQPNTNLLSPATPSVVNAFKGDEQRRMDYATPLLIIATLLTAISLLINSLLLSIESNRAVLSTLRMVGLTRSGTIAFVFEESLISGVSGWLVGVVVSLLALAAYVAADTAAFPVGMAVAWPKIALSLVALPFIILAAVCFVLRPALKVRAMDIASRMQRPRRRGMAITFACGFAAFVAVEVWGASLMRAFVPSPEWPDAIVSILPAGASSFDVEKLRDIPGVKRISELMPLQLFFPPTSQNRLKVEKVEEVEKVEKVASVEKIKQSNNLKSNNSQHSQPTQHSQPSQPTQPFSQHSPNALILASEWLPEFQFTEGNFDDASKGVFERGEVVITRMMSTAHNLHLGDELKVMVGRGEMAEEASLKIAGVVDLNWHMVTSRGLVRGLNRMPGMTDGPVFASFDTLESLDMRPAAMVKMTHLWLDYTPEFLAKHGVFPAGRIVEREIAKRLGNPVESTVRLHARDEIADGTLAHGSDVIGQAARVPFVFLAILAIGFVAMLVAEADARRHEFAVLRVVGATKGQLARILILSAVKTALTGMVIGLLLGSLVGWLFSFGTGSHWPGLPHYFVLPCPIVAEGALGAIIFALLFAIPTAVTLTKR